MKVDQGLTGVCQSKFSARVMKLILSIVSTAGTSAAALAAVQASTIEVTSSHPNYATKTRLYKNSLLDLMEIASCNEGAIRLDGAANAYTIKGSIELSDDGAIVPLDNEQFYAKFELAAGLTLQVNVLDAHVDAVTEMEYKPVPCFGGSPTPLTVAAAKWLAIPKARLTELQLELPNGQRIIYTPSELEQVVSEANEQSLLQNGLITPGSLNLYIMNVAPYLRAHVTTDTQTNVYIVNEKPVQ